MERLIAHRIPGEQLRVLLCIIRASYGWNEKSVSITHQEIADQTHIARPSVSRAISALVTKKLLTCNKKVTKNCNELIFNKNYDEWDNRPRRKTCNKKVTNIGNKKVTQNTVLPINRKKRKKPPISPKEKTSKPTRTKMTDEFPITDAMKKWFQSKNFQHIEIEDATETFKNYWKGTGKLMADWYATWQNGMKLQERWAAKDAKEKEKKRETFGTPGKML